MATWYALLLLTVIAFVAAFLVYTLRGIVLDQARARVDRIGTDIATFATRSESLVSIGESLTADQELAKAGNLEHWSSPTLYVQLENAAGYPIAKSANMGGAVLAGTAGVAKGKPAYAVERGALGEVLVRTERLEFKDGTTVIVKVAEQLDLFRQTLARISQAVILAGVLAVLAVVAGSYLIASRAIAPINALTEAVGEIGLDQLHRRIGWRGPRDEVGRLADSFDRMLERLEDGYARERQFISDASHELKTPLTVINANAQLLERWGDRDPAVRAESVDAIRVESAALARMVNGMLTLARAESGDAIAREPLSLGAVLAACVESAAARAREKNLSLRFEAPERELTVVANADLLGQLFSNLIDNAIKFTERGGIEVRARADGHEVIVEVADTGAGIDEEESARIFDRFYRTDKSRSRAVPGTGLGLSIVRSIARVHGGGVEARRAPGGGSIFRVTLPAAARSEFTGAS